MTDGYGLTRENTTKSGENGQALVLRLEQPASSALSSSAAHFLKMRSLGMKSIFSPRPAGVNCYQKRWLESGVLQCKT